MTILDDGDLSYGTQYETEPPEADAECFHCGGPAGPSHPSHDIDGKAYCDECAKHWGNW